jgi:hypothetical protein
MGAVGLRLPFPLCWKAEAESPRLVSLEPATRSIRGIRDGSGRLLEGVTQPVRGLVLAREEFLRRQAVLRRMLAQVPGFLYLTDRELRFIATADSDWAGLELELEGRFSRCVSSRRSTRRGGAWE